MPAKIKQNMNLHKAGFEDRVAATYRGMAHFAGTSPTGGVCRGCAHWQRQPEDWDRATCPSAYCTYPLPGKASVMVPGGAAACRLFAAVG